MTLDKRFFNGIADVINQARNYAENQINLAMVYSNYEIGKRIVEEEQSGSDRTEYGKQVIKKLAEFLTHEFGKGYLESS